MEADQLPITDRIRGRRRPHRVTHARDDIRAALDAAPIAHIGFVHNGGPVVIPTFHWVHGDMVYWHGSRASRAIRSGFTGEVCLTVTMLDALVLARSAFHHSANYRSVMMFGRPTEIVAEEEKLLALQHFMDRRFPGRWDQLRPVRPQELKATAISCLSIAEASIKVRDGGPIDDPEDRDAPVWAGIIPVSIQYGSAQPDGPGAGQATLPAPLVLP